MQTKLVKFQLQRSLCRQADQKRTWTVLMGSARWCFSYNDHSLRRFSTIPWQFTMILDHSLVFFEDARLFLDVVTITATV